MELSKENFSDLLPSLRLAARGLKGSKRIMFLGQLANDLGYGGITLVSAAFKVSPMTLRKDQGEIASGKPIKDQFSSPGRKPIGEKQPELLKDIKKILDESSQTDPQFKSTRLYTRLSAKAVREGLVKLGHQDSELPSNQTIWNKMHQLGFKRKKVAKTRPKKNKETDAIFEQLKIENREADENPEILRISYDAKDRVKIGNFFRAGKSWTQLQANDHDFCKEFITPFGLYLPQFGESHLYMTESKVTADFMVDVLEHFWKENRERFEQVNTIVINSDNGPECHSRRTQFIKRICEFAVQNNLTVKLAYYPPYHSKYNPIERVWGGLEQHWNASIS